MNNGRPKGLTTPTFVILLYMIQANYEISEEQMDECFKRYSPRAAEYDYSNFGDDMLGEIVGMPSK